MTNFWDRLLGWAGRPAPRRLEPPAPDRVAAVLDEMRAHARPCLRLAPGGNGRSHLGGTPQMAGPWPRYAGRPLSHLAQLDLAEMRAAGGPDWLPGEGRLLFFYELDYSGWGFDPKDAGCAVVCFEQGPAARAAEPGDLPEESGFNTYPVLFSADASLPSEERLGIDMRRFSHNEQAALEAAIDAREPAEPSHQVGGYPGPIQGDGMELECQRVTHGVYLGKPGRSQAKQTDELSLGAADWRLLLQLDTDDEAGMMWGDTGRLYFWIREQDARAGDFSKTWTILQCF